MFAIRPIMWGLCAVFFAWGCLFSQATLQAGDAWREKLDPLVQPYLDSELVVGMTIGLLHDGETYFASYGRLSEDNPTTPDENTVYEIGSVSKVFTGVLLADAVTRGEVTLDQPIMSLFPEKVKLRDNIKAITLRDLATHMSGLPTTPENLTIVDPANPYANYTLADLRTFLNGFRPPRAPGEKQEYSNLAVGLLSQLLAKKAALPFEQLLRERITQPLDMASTSVELNGNQQSRLATPHFADGRATSNWDMPALPGAGAIRSTASDMIKFLAASLEPPQSPLGESLELAWKVQRESHSAGEHTLGLCWHVHPDGQTRWHNGQTGGYHSIVYANRELKTAVVVLANTAAEEVDLLAQDIFLVSVGRKAEPRDLAKASPNDEGLRNYVGKYQFAPGLDITVSTRRGKLLAGITGQASLEVLRRSETEWDYKDIEASLVFNFDAMGRCESVELLQNGMRQLATRVGSKGGAKVEPRESEEKAPDGDEGLQRYAGKYRFAPGLDLTVTARGDRLFAGLTGQSSLQVFPRSETEWFLKVVDATLTFNFDAEGRCESVELFQNGVRQLATRVP